MLKQLIITIALVFFFGAFTLAQEQSDKKEKKDYAKEYCSDNNSHSNMKMSYMDADSTHKHQDKKSVKKMHQKHKEMKSSQKDNESIIREGEIDLKSIDKNKDGKVFQDQMCWNVISDEPGECPLCGMILKEVSLEKAKKNLQKNNYKVK